MPTKTKTTVTTPLGKFPTIAAAATAHKVDRTTLIKRLATLPEEYQRKVERIYVPHQPQITRGVRWPISWAQYRGQDYETREEIYQQWCKTQGLDPDAEHTADAFFDDMDMIQPQETQETQETQDDTEQELDV